MSGLVTHHYGYGFTWELGRMPKIEILDLLREDELEDFLDLDRELNIDRSSYYSMSPTDFEAMMARVMERANLGITNFIMSSVGNIQAQPETVCFVLDNAHHWNFMDEVTLPVFYTPAISPAAVDFVKKYFPDVELSWMVWAHSN